jgi:hypothetical protein
MKLLPTRARALMIGIILGAAGCGGGYSDYCTDAIDCSEGNDSDIDACEVTFEANEDIASIYDCSEEWDEYYTCLEERSECNGDQFGPEGDDCADEYDDLRDCED